MELGDFPLPQTLPVVVGVDAEQPPDTVTADIQGRLSALPQIGVTRS